MSWYSEIFNIVFADLDREKANTCVVCEWKKVDDEKRKKEKDETSSGKDKESLSSSDL